MTDNLNSLFDKLKDQPRLLIEAELRPIQGDRFQPTGFPDLGPATYKRADGTPMLLVESAQSMANRMEAVCWDESENSICATLRGLPHIVVDLGNGLKTSSIQEAHRLNSPYIIGDSDLKAAIIAEVGNPTEGPLDIRKLAKAVFERDVGGVLHGVFLEKVAGRLRLQRLLSSFIEAEGVMAAVSGGVKFDRVAPSGDAKEGYGNVPFSRTEFVARKITAYFNLDLATMRGYGLGAAANELLIALSLYKLLKLLDGGLRLRTACDLEMKSLTVNRPKDVSLEISLLDEIEKTLPDLIRRCEFRQPMIEIKGQVPAKKKVKGAKEGETAGAMQPGGGDEG